MCSTASFGGSRCDSSDTSVMTNTRTKKRTDVCFKCKTERPFVVIRQGDPFCGTCFESHLIHKFRQGLGKTKILYPGETVLLNITGNASSLAMLHLMASGYDKTSHKKITADPKIVIVDDSCLFDIAESCVPAVLRVIEGVPDMPRQIFVVPFQLVFLDHYRGKCREFYEENKSRAVVDFNEMDIDLEELTETARCLYEKIGTPSSKEDLHRSLQLQLLTSVAGIVRSAKVLMSDTSTDLAARLLTTVAVGRGSSLPNESQYLDPRIPGLTFINAMREFTRKECVFYLRRLAVPPITVVTHSTLSDPTVGSINRLADTFISGLQSNFPSTVSTVLKTAAKLRPVSGTRGHCGVCFLPLSRDTPYMGIASRDVRESPAEGSLCPGCTVAVSECEQGVRQLVSRTHLPGVLDEFIID